MIVIVYTVWGNRREFIRYEDILFNLFNFKYFIVTVCYTVPVTCAYSSLYKCSYLCIHFAIQFQLPVLYSSLYISSYLYIQFAIHFQLPVHTVRYTVPVTCAYSSLYISSTLYIQFAIHVFFPVSSAGKGSPKYCDTECAVFFMQLCCNYCFPLYLPSKPHTISTFRTLCLHECSHELPVMSTKKKDYFFQISAEEIFSF